MCVWGGCGWVCVNELCVNVTGCEVGVCGMCVRGGRGKCVRI